ncbi:protein MpABCC10 [Marchantia polymorpha subsp. ruderalis]|uniref:Uncharacterized protein n=2 Tax=Marchantia polymorpha TaxID=3197 RepID=A0AAF6BFP7_MARPO|nr:hypothetical protein MARPO_0171s0004 [Marchantia polymorpha]BBN10831.1 hypothetical protein Mp_5g06790 [Marchantia polymorpha subsp. ruderalis]|eukprot:PTQ28161.1 hypothetical protein MARPO_0171s0004 [Marchantia polymorpha]
MAKNELRYKSQGLTAGPSPELKANFFSFFSWHFVQPFINKGNEKILQPEDLYDLIPRETSEFGERMWEKYARKQLEKKDKINVFKLALQTSGRELIWSFVLCPFWLVAVVAQVFVLKELVTEAENLHQKLQPWKGAMLVLGMLLTSNVQSVCQHWLFTYGQKSGMRVKAAISMAVFNKLMKLRMVALAGTSSGLMLNLVTNDTQKLIDGSTFLSYTCFAVINSLVVAGIALGLVGYSALPGVLVIILALPAQMSIARAVGRMRKHAVKLTDVRVRMIAEILTGVRVVKYNGWTTAFLKRISSIRSMELRWIRKAAMLRASTSTFKDLISPVAALVTFGTYVATNDGILSASKAFTILGLYGILVRIYSIAPIGVQYGFEAYIGLQRLQRLLDLPYGHGHSSEEQAAQLRKLYPEAAVIISQGTFAWYLKEKDFEDSTVAPGVSQNKQQEVHSDPSLAKASDEVKKPVSKDLDQVDDMIDAKENHSLAQLRNINLAVKKGELIAVIGSVGSGKSSLLCALLGEMEAVKGSFWTEKMVSYAPQQPWILNDTVRNNIVTSNFYDEDLYKKVVFACALEHDMAQLPAGDDTEIGERGVNLSGGQKARISLARACYSQSPVVLLDDPLAAVDVPTAKHLMKHVLNGILKGRTVILVTHNISSLELVDRIFMMEEGRLIELESRADVAEKGLLQELADESGEEADEDADIDISVKAEAFGASESGKTGTADHEDGVPQTIPQPESPKAGLTSNHQASTMPLNGMPETKGMDYLVKSESRKGSSRKSGSARQEGVLVDTVSPQGATSEAVGSLTVKEDRVEGEVTWKSYADYARGGGLIFFTFVLFLMCFAQAVRVIVDYWISVWVSDKLNTSSNIYLMSYGILVLGSCILCLARAMLFTEAAIRSAQSMHGNMTEKVIRSPQTFFDQNPVGRILNRFGKDQAMVDEILPNTAQSMFENLVAVLGVMIFIAVIIPWFLLVLPPFVLAFYYCQQKYVAVSRELRRLDGISRSPTYAHFSQTLQGIASVRAYNMEAAMLDHFRDLMDANHRAYILFVHTSRWLGVRLDYCAAVCVTVTALLAVLLRHKISPGLLGVVLIQSLQLTGFFQYGVRLVADTENIFTSVERIQAYGNLPSEADPNSPPGLISDQWPEKGEVEFVEYTLAYRTDLPAVLNKLSFKIFSQEKVGILGRTGAGKSSLAAALFRMVENAACSGTILVDNVDLKLVGLDDLRQRLSIIPQDPVLFQGTIRFNLDPFEMHTDAELHEALSKVEMTAKIKSLKGGLTSEVQENGDNFSVGQRQLLCLARSLLRKSKIVVMDEATAAVDGETDQLIQRTMRSVFHDCTVLTIAHRIDTIIDCDRVLILAKGGRISEFDSPANLLRRAEEVDFSDTTTSRVDHVFANMVAQAGPKVAKQLRQAAEAANERRKLVRSTPEDN